MKILPKLGKVYKVHHSRKGSFVAECVQADPEGARFKIIGGEANFISRENAVPGETISVMHFLSRYEEVTP